MKYCPLCGTEYAEGDACPADGAVLIAVKHGTDPLIGQVLKGSYRIEEQIGAGGMGAVYRAVQMPLGRDVAVKSLLPSLVSTPSMVQRFFQEAKLLSQLSHPNVVGIIDFGNTETGMIFMVMEYLDGFPLSRVVPLGKGLSLSTTLRLIQQVCAGVGAAHRCNLVHRDLKPDNIFVSQSSGGQEAVKVLDFGIARVLEGEQATRLTQTGLLMGTPGFIAPEQIEATSEADARSDIYALGGILYFMLTGVRPYDGKTPHSIFVQQLQETPSADLGLLAEHPALAAVVLKAMHRHPDARYQTAEEFIAALEQTVDAATPRAESAGRGSTPVGTPRAGKPTAHEGEPRELEPTVSLNAPQGAPRLPWRQGGLWAAALLLAMLTVAAIVWTTSRGGGDRESRGAASAATVRGVTATRIDVGMSAAFSGASRELGRGMQLGIETCFFDVNENGGVHGRELKLVALDDGYEPSRTVANMTDLLFERKVFAVLGNVGTPTAEVALPLVLEQQIPFFGAFTGADLLRRQPPDRHVFNYRASYAEETAGIVGYFLDVVGLNPSQVAVFAQDDSFGDAGYHGVVNTLAERGHAEAVPRLGYRRNTMAVESAVQEMLEQHEPVRAVVLVATYRAAAEFIRQLEDAGRDLTYASLSFIGSRAFAEELREKGSQYSEGVIVTQVVPHFASQEAGVVRYRELLSRHFPAEQPGFVSLEGYLAARIFVEALSRAGEELTLDSFVAAAESIADLDLGIGSKISFSRDRHQGASQVWGTVLDSSASYQVLDLVPAK